MPHVDPLWDMKLSVIIAHTIWWMSGLLLYILLNKGANYWECCASVSKGNTKKVFVVSPDVYPKMSQYFNQKTADSKSYSINNTYQLFFTVFVTGSIIKVHI